MTAPIDEIESDRRRGYLRDLYRSRGYRSASRAAKVKMRRALLAKEVPIV